MALADETQAEGEVQAESAIDECMPEENALLSSESTDAVIPSDEAEQDMSDEPFETGHAADIDTTALDDTSARDAPSEVPDETVEPGVQGVAETDGANDELLVETIEEVDDPAWSDSPNVESGDSAPDAVDGATDEGSNVYRLSHSTSRQTPSRASG